MINKIQNVGNETGQTIQHFKQINYMENRKTIRFNRPINQMQCVGSVWVLIQIYIYIYK